MSSFNRRAPRVHVWTSRTWLQPDGFKIPRFLRSSQYVCHIVAFRRMEKYFRDLRVIMLKIILLVGSLGICRNTASTTSADK